MSEPKLQTWEVHDGYNTHSIQADDWTKDHQLCFFRAGKLVACFVRWHSFLLVNGCDSDSDPDPDPAEFDIAFLDD